MPLEEKLEFCKKLLEEAQKEAKEQLRFNDGESIYEARRAIKEVLNYAEPERIKVAR